MKRLLAIVVLFLFLPGCSRADDSLSRAISLREKVLYASGCCFDAIITADYKDYVYTFSLNCEVDNKGNLKFTVTDPETISGISGTVSDAGGTLTFDNNALAFDVLADGQITPVSAPWHFMNTLRGGYFSACGDDGEYLRISADDSYEGETLHFDIWLDENDLPLRGEILWQGRRIISLDVRNFRFV